MAGLADFLAQILNPNPGTNRLANPGGGGGGNYLTQTGLGPDQMARYHQMSGMGGGMPQMPAAAPAGPPGMGMTGQAPMMLPAQNVPQAPPMVGPAPMGGGGILGGLRNLFGGGGMSEQAKMSHTENWLTTVRGLDPGTARALTMNPKMLQDYLSDAMKPQKRQTAVIDGKLVDTDTGEVVGDYGSETTSDWVKLDDGRLFNNKTAEIKDVGTPGGGGGQFAGTSVEAQSLNWLVENGELTPGEAAQLGAGKTITNPEDGSMIFQTPQGIFSRPPGGGPDVPFGATPTVAPPPVDASVPPPVVSADPGSVAPLPSNRPGQIQLTPGKPGKLATEAETRNRALYTVAAPDMKIALENHAALSNVYSQAASKILPWGTDNYLTSPDYQRAYNAMKNVVQTYNYSVSGAAAPESEVARTVQSLLPGPGEAPASVGDKKARLETMVSAIRQAGGNWTPPAERGKPAPGGVEPTAAGDNFSPEGKKYWDGWQPSGLPGVKIRRKR